MLRNGILVGVNTKIFDSRRRGFEKSYPRLRKHSPYACFIGYNAKKRRGRVIHELEKMCLQREFDKEKAEQIMKQIDVNQVFKGLRSSLDTTLLTRAAEEANYEMVSQYQPKLNTPKGRKSALFLENSLAKSALCFVHFQKISSNFRIFR